MSTSTSAPNPTSTITPSPLSQSTTTSQIAPSDAPAINADAPAELDSSQEVDLKRRSTGLSVAVLSPDLEEEEVLRELGLAGEAAEGEVVEKLREKRAKILATRSKDPAVLVDLPQFPTADEVAAAKASEGTVTPGLAQRELGAAEGGGVVV